MDMLLTAVAAAAAALAQPAADPLPNAKPALWRVQDEDTTVYLFGTFHTLDGRSNWFNEDVQAAFTVSDELVLETLLPKLDQRLPRGLTGSDVRSQGVTPSASFVGATRLAVSAGRDSGLDVRKGADVVLRRKAEDSGKAVEGLETVEFQLNMLKRMATAAPTAGRQVEMVRNPRSRMAQLMTEMQASWNRGDQSIFAVLLDQMRQTSPQNYYIMFPERNGHWAEWIVDRMERPGVVFVAVGAGHFAGRDSVLAKLTSKGVVATRIN